jgi:hypothetical protein
LAIESILWSLLFGSIGIGYFIYGKRQAHAVARYTGIVLMIYPYFVGDTMILVAVGVGLLFVPRFLKL